jgi:hypothetical protein
MRTTPQRTRRPAVRSSLIRRVVAPRKGYEKSLREHRVTCKDELLVGDEKSCKPATHRRRAR